MRNFLVRISFGAKFGCLFILSSYGLISSASATVLVEVDLSRQRMFVHSSRANYTWPVSTARSGYETPAGEYEPIALERMHYSQKYDNAPMPYSIFFYGGYAIHGSSEIRSLGRPASHGCIRLAPGNAKLLYEMVEAEGALISITGAPPSNVYDAQIIERERNRSRRIGVIDEGAELFTPDF